MEKAFKLDCCDSFDDTAVYIDDYDTVVTIAQTGEFMERHTVVLSFQMMHHLILQWKEHIASTNNTPTFTFSS